MNIDLVKDALEYYDNNTEKYSNFLKKVKQIKFYLSSGDIDPDYIYFFDKDEKLIHKSTYQVIGTRFMNIWTWAWSIPTFHKKNLNTIIQILKYGIELDTIKNPENMIVKTELITSKFEISDPIQIDMHLAIVSYLSKSPLIFNYIEPEEFKSEQILYDEDIINIVEDKKNDNLKYYLFIIDLPYD